MHCASLMHKKKKTPFNSEFLGYHQEHTKMSQLSSASLTAVLVLLAAAAAAVGTAAPAGSACQNDIDVLKTTCYKYVEKGTPTVPPSPECCAAMEGVDVPCVCNYLGTPSVKDNISLEKVFYVTKQCGVSIPGNCGESKRV